MRSLLICISTIMLWLSGCIIVEDFKDYWDRGSLDSRLDGVWHMPQSQKPAIIFSPTQDSYHIIVPDEVDTESLTPSEHARTLKIGRHHFLMIKNSEDNSGGDLVRYTIKNDMLTLYSPRSEKREDFQQNYAGSNILVNDHTARIKQLDVRTIRILQSFAAKPDYWEVMGTYIRKEKK